MITAMEIRNQQFSKSLRGYDQDEVKNFLMQLAQDYENLYSQNATLKESIKSLLSILLPLLSVSGIFIVNPFLVIEDLK